jgi:hypothetical protein
VKIKIGDLVSGADMRTRAIVIQQKTGKPVQFELTADVRASLLACAMIIDLVTIAIWGEGEDGRACDGSTSASRPNFSRSATYSAIRKADVDRIES